jgi:hypothetical protein
MASLPPYDDTAASPSRKRKRPTGKADSDVDEEDSAQGDEGGRDEENEELDHEEESINDGEEESIHDDEEESTHYSDCASVREHDEAQLDSSADVEQFDGGTQSYIFAIDQQSWADLVEEYHELTAISYKKSSSKQLTKLLTTIEDATEAYKGAADGFKDNNLVSDISEQLSTALADVAPIPQDPNVPRPKLKISRMETQISHLQCCIVPAMIWMIPDAVSAYERLELSADALLAKVIKLLELLSHLCEQLRPSNYAQFSYPDHLKATRLILKLLILQLKIQTPLPHQVINEEPNASPQPQSDPEPEPEQLPSPAQLSSPSERSFDHDLLPDTSQGSEIGDPWDDSEAAALVKGLQRHLGEQRSYFCRLPTSSLTLSCTGHDRYEIIAEELGPRFGFRPVEELRAKAREIREDYFDAMRWNGDQYPERTYPWY